MRKPEKNLDVKWQRHVPASALRQTDENEQRRMIWNMCTEARIALCEVLDNHQEIGPITDLVLTVSVRDDPKPVGQPLKAVGDPNAGENLDWFPTKREAVEYLNDHHRRINA